MNKKIVIICGPTASGKSAFAMKLALMKNGAIINADSMQIYKEIPVLTASPSEEDKKLVPHHLYNYLPMSDSFSVMKYIMSVSDELKLLADRHLPIIVGGTGLYINGLINGINSIPDVDISIRQETEDLMQNLGKEAFHQALSKLDPVAAANIKPGDKQRMIRAYEVFRQTGKSILYFRTISTKPILEGYDISVIMLSPERDLLYKNCNERFLNLLNMGAIDEVKANREKHSSALGFAELKSYLDSQLTLDEAVALAQTKTRQYAKRQVTWFTHQISNKKVISFSSMMEYHHILENIATWVDL